MALTILSDALSMAVYLGATWAFHSTPYILLLGSGCIWLSGGSVAFITMALQYLTKRTSEETRMGRFVLLQIIIVIGRPRSNSIRQMQKKSLKKWRHLPSPYTNFE